MTDSKTAPAENDTVLKIAWGITVFLQWMFILAMIFLILAIPCLFIFSDLMLDAMGEILVTKPDFAALLPMAALISVGLFILALGYFALHRLRSIIESVSIGDPFTPINGIRLRGMGLAVLVIEGLSIIGSAIFAWLLATLGEWKPNNDGHIEMDAEISLYSILLGLLLIILGRVFDRGAAMRAELEATI